ncbi:hypothetical protein [Achromobacter aloeverae]
MLSDLYSYTARNALPPDPVPRDAIEAHGRHAPTMQWAVLGLDDAEIFRCPSLEQAYRAIERLRPQLNEKAAKALRVAEAAPEVAPEPTTPETMPEGALEAARRLDDGEGSGPGGGSVPDCTWLLRRLGYVTIFAFSRDDSDARFLVVGRDGQRVEGPTLTAALHALLRARDCASRLPPAAGPAPSSWQDDDV